MFDVNQYWHWKSDDKIQIWTKNIIKTCSNIEKDQPLLTKAYISIHDIFQRKKLIWKEEKKESFKLPLDVINKLLDASFVLSKETFFFNASNKLGGKRSQVYKTVRGRMSSQDDCLGLA